ncbi:Protein disulfide-isomerase [Smittium mucronatum]|uniref:Protein disulfide-isomerase n=1 Tax=Smittium mucronatum TaxID=133383 RepID=A0A1R0GQS6_9FUNG|nr:Protein disulfide-isomerase [Smittium mucronatum]
MKISSTNIYLFGSIISAFSSFVSAGNAASSDTLVNVLTDNNFDDFIKNHDLALVKFYAPWCGHCKSLAPEFDSASLLLKQNNITLGKIDCTESKVVCDKYKIQGYPTLFVFNKGENLEYKGNRKSDGIVSYMIKQSQPALSEVTSANFDDFSKSDRVVVISHYKKDSPEQKVFEDLSSTLRDDFVFGYTYDDELASSKLGKDKPSITVFKSFAEPEVYSGKFEENQITKFLNLAAVEVLAEISGENYNQFMKSGLPLGFLFYEGQEMKDKLHSKLLEASSKFRDNFHYVFIDAAKYGDMAKSMDLKPKWPAFAFQNQNTRLKHLMPQDQEINAENLEKFSKGVVDGSIPPTIKSEPVPKENPGPVMNVVANSFEQIVMDVSKDVLIEFYAPWCGHCKKLEPTYNKLGKLSAKFPSIVIAKMDATENDIPVDSEKFAIQGFPTIMFVSAKTNEVTEYSGDRSIASLIAFIEKHSSEKVEYNYSEEKKDSDAEEEAPVEADEDELEAEADKESGRDEL